MKHKKIFISLAGIVAVGLSGILMVSCKSKRMTGMIILTQSAEKNAATDFISGEFWRYIPGARLVALDPDNPGKSLKVLSGGFYSACSPDISYDGKTMLFAGQRKEGDAWQIWEMDLGNSKTRQITSSEDDCTDPVYLPGNRLIYSRILAFDTLRAGFSLYVGNLDGSDMHRITFSPNSYLASNTLREGRILAISRELYPAQEDPALIVMRPDGTKADLFYKGAAHSTLSGRALETHDGKIVFTECDSANRESGQLISISYGRPLNSRINLSSGIKGGFLTVVPRPSGMYLVTYRKSATDRYALYEFDPEKRALGPVVYASGDYNVLDAVVAEERTRPKKLPSEVDTGVKTGLLLCQDIHYPGARFTVNAPTQYRAAGIEVLGLNSSYGTVIPEADGSFYIKAMADTPFRIQTVDAKGRVVKGPCTWMWIRPNERRGCIGCHEDRELSPENNVPLAVKKDPVIIPVHSLKITEKEVELE